MTLITSIASSMREIESVLLQDLLKLQSSLNILFFRKKVSFQPQVYVVLWFLYLCSFVNVYQTYLQYIYVCQYCLIYMVHFTSLQVFRPSVQMEPLVGRGYISVISDIVSFPSERLEHLAIHFYYESYQLCMSMECNIFLLVLCEYH